MKKVVRLTESDLSRIVRRVINEEQTSTTKTLKSCYSNAPSNISTIAKELFDATNKLNFAIWSNFDETKIANALLKLKSKQQYDQVNKVLVCAFDFVCMDGFHPCEPGAGEGVDFIKATIDESLFDYLDSHLNEKVMNHFVTNRIFDKSSEYCSDQLYVGSDGIEKVKLYCKK